MKRIFLIVFLVAVFITSSIEAKLSTKKTSAVSTQGVEVSESDVKNAQNQKTEKKISNQKKKNRKNFLHNIKKLDKFENKKRIKNRDKEFIETRLELKKQKLDDLSKPSIKKGEDEE